MIEQAASVGEAVAALVCMVAWDGGARWMPVYLDGAESPSSWVDVRLLSRGVQTLVERCARWEGVLSQQVEVGLPQRERGVGGPGDCTVLWAWVESKDQAFRVWRRFRPAPTMVLKMGGSCRRLVLWAMHEPVPYVLVEGGNRRVAYSLGAPQKYSEPERLRIPLPGTFLRVGRVRPVPVLVTRLVDSSFSRAAVCGRLKDPPAPYMQRLREGKVKPR